VLVTEMREGTVDGAGSEASTPSVVRDDELGLAFSVTRV
jgi:hypothetical protein